MRNTANKYKVNFRKLVMKKVLGFMYRYIFLSDARTRYHVRLLLWLKHRNKMKMLCFFLREGLRKKYHVIIAKNAQIGSLRFPHPHNVVIGDLTRIGNNCTLYHDVTLGQNLGYFPTLGDNVIVYTGAKVIGGVTVGNNVIIGANAVVTTDVPDNAIVAGIPAKIIKYRREDHEFR